MEFFLIGLCITGLILCGIGAFFLFSSGLILFRAIDMHQQTQLGIETFRQQILQEHEKVGKVLNHNTEQVRTLRDQCGKKFAEVDSKFKQVDKDVAGLKPSQSMLN